MMDTTRISQSGRCGDLTMPQFILKIDLGEGMSAGDIADDLYDVFLALSGGCGTTGDIRDINGNVVGHYEVVDS